MWTKILKLSVEERMALIQIIWDSLDMEQEENLLTKEQEAELNRRIGRHERGEGNRYTWEEVKQRLDFKT